MGLRTRYRRSGSPHKLLLELGTPCTAPHRRLPVLLRPRLLLLQQRKLALYNLGRHAAALPARRTGAFPPFVRRAVHGALRPATLLSAWREPLLAYIARIPLDKIVGLMEALSAAEEQMRWSANKRLHLELGIIQAVHSLAQANISDIIKALNGAPLPETPIATEVLPDIPLPVAGETEPPAPVRHAQISPVSAEESVHAASEPAAFDASVSTPPELFPIDDDSPDFGPAESETPVAETPVIALSAELWEQAVQSVRSKAPLKAGLIGNTLFVGEENGLLTVAIHPTDTSSRDALLCGDVGALLRETLREKLGREIERIQVVTDESVPEPVVEEPEPVSPPSKTDKTTQAPSPTEEEPDKEQKSPIPEEDFYRDPLIESALRELEARIITQP